MKNIACAGALVAMLGIDMEVIAQLLTEQFAGKPVSPELVDYLHDGGGTRITTSLEGTPLITAVQRSGMSGWAVAVGLPVVFHVNAAPQLLDSLYQEAAIYWHGTGLQEDLKKSPELVWRRSGCRR